MEAQIKHHGGDRALKDGEQRDRGSAPLRARLELGRKIVRMNGW